MLDVQEVGRDEYNRKVQSVQALPTEYRIEVVRSKLGDIVSAHFEVYYGTWTRLGVQWYPFTEKSRYMWDHGEEAKLLYAIAGDVSR